LARPRLLLAGRVGVSGMLAAACYCFDVGVLKVLGEKFDHLRRGTVEHDRHGQQSNEGVLRGVHTPCVCIVAASAQHGHIYNTRVSVFFLPERRGARRLRAASAHPADARAAARTRRRRQHSATTRRHAPTSMMPQGKDADDGSPSGLGAAAGEQW